LSHHSQLLSVGQQSYKAFDGLQLFLTSIGKPVNTLADGFKLIFDPSSCLLAVHSIKLASITSTVWDILPSKEIHVIEMEGGYHVSELACSTTGRIASVLDISNDPMLHV
jgi:hypothetical protein